MHDDHERDWHDRAVDSALRELHGEAPPELLAGVLQRLHAPPVPEPAPRRPGARVLAWTGVLATLAALVVVWLFATAPVLPATVVRLDVAVLQGEIECVEFAAPPRAGHQRDLADGSVTRLGAGASHEFAAQAGNRLRCSDGTTAMVMGPFGVLTATPHSDMEVESMEWTMKNGAVATGALTLAVVAGTVTWQSLAQSQHAAAGESLRLETKGDAAARLQELAELEQLRKTNTELQQRVETLTTQLARTEAPKPAPAPAPKDEPPPASTDTSAHAPPTFDDPAFHDGLSAIDWQLLGEVTNEMGPKLVDLLQKMDEEGADTPVDLAVAVQKLNQKLIEQVPALMKAHLPGFGPNGVFTHPLVVANSLATALSAAGQQLTPAQQATLGNLMRGFAVENASLAQSTHDFDLEGLAAEVAMKDRMYQQVADQLTPEQRAVMYPPGAGAHDGSSLFSTGVMWQVYSEGVPATNAADFARTASNKLAAGLGLDEAATAQMRQVLERSAAKAPELWTDRASPIEQSTGRMLRTGRAQQALQRQLQWMREISSTVPLSPEQRKKLAGWRKVLVPLPR